MYSFKMNENTLYLFNCWCLRLLLAQINMIFVRFHKLEPVTSCRLQQRLWIFCLLSLLSPTPSPNRYTETIIKGIDQLMEISLGVLLEEKEMQKGNSRLEPYSIGYDSEEETVETGIQNYESMLRLETKHVSFHSFVLPSIIYCQSSLIWNMGLFSF